MELSGDTKNALVQLLAQRINAGLQQGLQQANITHTNRDRKHTTVSPAEWNASIQADRKHLRTAITCSAGATADNLVIQIWLGYDVKPISASGTSSIPFDAMLAGVDDTGSNGPYPEVFKSGTTPPVRYFALEPNGSDPVNEGYQEPKYPVYSNVGSTFPIPGAGAVVT